MCGIAGLIHLNSQPVGSLKGRLAVMNNLLAHRGPDGEGLWQHPQGNVGLAHRRLSIIDLSTAASQPMQAANGNVVAFNGEIYNFLELKEELSSHWAFKSHSDTETILAAYEKFGTEALTHLRGMFAFALWDEKKGRLLCARDRFGIKPFYYTVVDNIFYFASEIKALLPFLPSIETDPTALSEYLTFQYTLGENTLFKGVFQLMPGHSLVIEKGTLRQHRYWDVRYEVDYYHSTRYFEEKLASLVNESLKVHLRSDVPVASYLSGGIDSSLIALLAAQQQQGGLAGAFHGRFLEYPGYDESQYAKAAAEQMSQELKIVDITAADFEAHFSKVIYHLDMPVAGPGSFPQYMVSRLAGDHVKVILGGQGGDELFGGYARYVVAYFEQCIKAAIDGTYKNGNFVVTPESIIPNLTVLKEYKPLIKEFWKEGLFEGLDERYFRLVDRSTDMTDEIDWNAFDRNQLKDRFKTIFNNQDNVRKEAYFDKMTHFDFKCLLPALLHVEDRMSMAHGLEARVPLLDHPLVEFAATIPADIKFEGGRMKHLLKNTFSHILPAQILNRRDKMGFPVPLKEWFEGPLKSMVHGIFNHTNAKTRPFMNHKAILANLEGSARFSRKIWGLLSLEMWYQLFHDQQALYRKKLKDIDILAA